MTDVKNEAPLIQLNDAIVRRDGKNILEVDSFVLRSGENLSLIHICSIPLCSTIMNTTIHLGGRFLLGDLHGSNLARAQ